MPNTHTHTRTPREKVYNLKFKKKEEKRKNYYLPKKKGNWIEFFLQFIYGNNDNNSILYIIYKY